MERMSQLNNTVLAEQTLDWLDEQFVY